MAGSAPFFGGGARPTLGLSLRSRPPPCPLPARAPPKKLRLAVGCFVPLARCVGCSPCSFLRNGSRAFLCVLLAAWCVLVCYAGCGCSSPRSSHRGAPPSALPPVPLSSPRCRRWAAGRWAWGLQARGAPPGAGWASRAGRAQGSVGHALRGLRPSAPSGEPSAALLICAPGSARLALPAPGFAPFFSPAAPVPFFAPLCPAPAPATFVYVFGCLMLVFFSFHLPLRATLAVM